MNIRAFISRLVRKLPLISGMVERREFLRHNKVIDCRLLEEIPAEARRCYEEEQPTTATWEQYMEAFRRFHCDYSEFFHQYEFYKLSDEEREEFCTRTNMRIFYRGHYDKQTLLMFWDKVRFFSAFPEYIHRRWLRARTASYSDFNALVTSVDCIAKPLASTCGCGVFKIYKDRIEDPERLYRQSVEDDLLIEECIEGCPELQQFHPSSLNSIRVMTICNRREGDVFASFFRMGGGGAIVDNAHCGGIFATVDPKTGEVVTDGLNTKGEHFTHHPDTGIPIKGFRIPRWHDIRNTCIEAGKKYSGTVMIGWDVVINSKGEIEFVEGNHAPDVDLVQSPMKRGCKRELQLMLQKYLGNKYSLV